jgi:hypothetical protein
MFLGHWLNVPAFDHPLCCTNRFSIPAQEMRQSSTVAFEPPKETERKIPERRYA